MESIKVSGAKEVVKAFDSIIKNYPKQTVSAGLKAAAKPFVEKVKNIGPTPEFSKLAGIKVYTKKEKPLMAVGLFGGKNKKVKKTTKSGAHMSMWFVSYWINHGTLANRSTSYRFSNARKSISKKWKGGIKATDDMRKAWESTKQQVISAIPVKMQRASEKYMKRKFKSK